MFQDEEPTSPQELPAVSTPILPVSTKKKKKTQRGYNCPSNFSPTSPLKLTHTRQAKKKKKTPKRKVSPVLSQMVTRGKKIQRFSIESDTDSDFAM